MKMRACGHGGGNTLQLIFKYIKPYLWRMTGGMTSKFLGTVVELFIPFLMEIILDEKVPAGDIRSIYVYGGLMLLCAAFAWGGNILANRNASMAALPFGGRVVVIDSGAVAGGLFLLVLRARHMVTLGHPMSRIKAELESYKNTLKISFTTASVKVLQNANKLVYKPPAEGAPTDRRPIFSIENGSIGVTDFTEDDGPQARATVAALLAGLEDSRGGKRALSDAVSAEGDLRRRRGPSHVVVHYADRTRAVEYLLHRLQETYPTATIYERPITLSIQLNLGHDIIGVIGD